MVQAVERAKQVTMAELNAIIGVSHLYLSHKHINSERMNKKCIINVLLIHKYVDQDPVILS